VSVRTSLAAAAVGGALTVATLTAPGPGAQADDLTAQQRAGQTPASAPAAPRSPNVVLLTVDDMMTSDLAVMPHTRKLLANRGTTFTQGIAPTPICVPSRVSMLTGQYAHNHHAVTISGPGGGFPAFSGGRDANTLPVWLRRGGYSTLYVGKYLNGYGDTTRSAHYVPDGWGAWRATLGGSTYTFTSTRFTLNGRRIVRPPGYSTDIISRYTRDMLHLQHRATPRKSFFLWANYVAPHDGGRHESDDPHPSLDVPTTTPAARHRNRFRHKNLPRVEEMWQHTRSRWSGPRATRRYRAAVREMYQQRLEALLAVDQAVAATVKALRRNGDLANTVILFTSDNGYLTGHHSRIGKLVPWDSSLRIPVIARGPGIPAGRRVSTPITTADIAVSIAGLAKVRPGRTVDGMDILRLSRQHPQATRIIPIEAYPVKNGSRPIYTGIRFASWTYLRNAGGREELYDRRTDPGELTNLAGRKRYRDILVEFRSMNRRYRDCAGEGCPQQLDPEPVGAAR
jgi:arylsulfatase A-like enzyme